MNTASIAGGAIFFSDINTVRIDCSQKTTEDHTTAFYTRQQWESMNVIHSTQDLCPSWINNSADTYGDGVGTYAAAVEMTIHEEAKNVTIRSNRDPYIIRSHASGTLLPDISLKFVDLLGQGPAVGVNNYTVKATMSSDDFLSGTITKQFSRGIGNFLKVVGFQVPGTYDVAIDFSEESLEGIGFRVEIRSCSVGETETSNRLFCEQCSTTTYSFNLTGGSACLPCPENADCTSITIRPEKGYWNQFPCSDHVQRCLTKRACDYENREQKLEEVDTLSTNCTYDNTALQDYEEALCRQAHKGPLCGSCKENYGKSQSFSCAECFTGIGNLMLVLMSIVMLIGLASFTTRSNLESFTKFMTRRMANNGLPGPSSEPDPEVADLEMMEKYYLGRTALDEDRRMRPRRIDIHQCAARRSELAKWKSVELFKIMVNFVQITAIAIAINVEWSVLLIGLFETAEFIGGITSEATNRSVDCLISDSSSLPRSVVATIIDLFVPAAVVGLFVIFWTLIAVRKKEGFTYILKRSVLSALAVFYISYISITKTLVNILNCIKVHDSMIVMVDHTADYWAVDMSLKCYEGSHAVLAGSVGWPLLILFSLLFPIAVAITIMRTVKKDYEDGWIYDVAGFMYRSYGQRYVFWESIMLRKAILAVVVVFAYPLESSMQLVLAVFVITLSLYLQMICRPYRKEFDSLNEMEGVSLLVSLLTFVSSLCFDNDHLPFGVRVSITIAIFVCNTGLFFFFIAMFFIFSSDYLKAVLDREGIHYQADGGTIHILRVYVFDHLRSRVLAGFRAGFEFLVGQRCYDTN